MAGKNVERARCARAKSLARSGRRMEARLAMALLAIEREHAYRALGYRRIQEFAEQELDMSARKAKELARLARKLERLPRVRAAFTRGKLGWTKCRQVARVATPADEDAWITKASGLTSRGLERAALEAKGEPPMRRVVVKMTEDQARDFERAVARIREERGRAVTYAEALQEIARRSLGGPAEKPGDRPVIEPCATNEVVSPDVGEATLAASNEVARQIDLRDPDAPPQKSGPEAARANVIARDGGRCRCCGVRTGHIHRAIPGCDDIDSSIVLCWTCHLDLVYRRALVIAPLGGGRFELRVRDGTCLRTPRPSRPPSPAATS